MPRVYLFSFFIFSISVTLQSPDYLQFIVVDFNSLDINFNLQTWVVILDFFGIGSGESPVSSVRGPSVG
jgi:hypothetical protein